MLKRLMNFLLFSTGITPKDHKVRDKYAAIRAKRAEWEKMQHARQDANAGLLAGTTWVGDSDHSHDHGWGGDGGGSDGGGGGGGGDGGGGGGGGD